MADDQDLRDLKRSSQDVAWLALVHANTLTKHPPKVAFLLEDFTRRFTTVVMGGNQTKKNTPIQQSAGKLTACSCS